MAQIVIRTTVSPGEVAAYIDDCYGQMYPIVKALQCTRSAVKKIFDEYPEIKEKFNDSKDNFIDRVILGTMEEALAGNAKARELILKSLGRDRGFGDKLEISGDKNAPLVFFHSSPRDLAGTPPKDKRIESWTGRAIEYHDAQVVEAKEKSVDELLAIKPLKGAK